MLACLSRKRSRVQIPYAQPYYFWMDKLVKSPVFDTGVSIDIGGSKPSPEAILYLSRRGLGSPLPLEGRIRRFKSYCSDHYGRIL